MFSTQHFRKHRNLILLSDYSVKQSHRTCPSRWCVIPWHFAGTVSLTASQGKFLTQHFGGCVDGVTFSWSFVKLRWDSFFMELTISIVSETCRTYLLPPKGLYISTKPLYITLEPITRRPTSSCQRCYDWIVPSFSHQRGHYSKLAYKFKPGQMDLSHSTRLRHFWDRLRQHCVMEIRHLSQLRLGQLQYEWQQERLRCPQ